MKPRGWIKHQGLLVHAGYSFTVVSTTAAPNTDILTETGDALLTEVGDALVIE